MPTKSNSTPVDIFLKTLKQMLQGQPGFQSLALGSNLDVLKELEKPFEKSLSATIGKYSQVSPVIQSLQGRLAEQFREIIQEFPTFVLFAAAQLRNDPKYQTFIRDLQIAAIGCLISNGLPRAEAAVDFVKAIDAELDSKTLHDELFNKSKGHAYLPQKVFWDLYLIGKYFHLLPTTSKNELIETKFLVQGIFYVFFKYYFDLMALAPNDTVATHIDEIFSNFFVSIRNSERKYWGNIANVDILQVQLEHIIAQNKPPCFFRDRFDLLKIYNPMLRQRDDSSSRLLKEQIQTWGTFTCKKQVLFLSLVNNCKGTKYCSYLMLQLYKLNQETFFELEAYLQQHQEQRRYTDLYVLIKRLPVLRKSGASHAVQASHAKSATEKTAVNFNDPNIDPDVRNWGKYLKKFHKIITKDGQLGEDQIPIFFKGFAEASSQMLREKKVTQKTAKDFKKSMDHLMIQFVKRSGVSKQELKIYQNHLEEEMEDLSSSEYDNRAKKIDNIGSLLLTIKNKEIQYEDLYREALTYQLRIMHQSSRIEFTVEEVLLLPLPNRQKERLLETFVPGILSDLMMTAIYNLRLSAPDTPDCTASIYDIGKYSKLKTEKLLQLLEASRGFDALLDREIIPIEFNNNTINFNIREFFTLPLSSKKKQPDEEWYSQHMEYLKYQTERNEFAVSSYEIIQNNVAELPTIDYTKYFRIFHHGKFQESTMEALIGLWQNSGLDKLRK